MLVVSCQNWCMRAVCRALAAVTVASCWIVCTRSLFLFSDCCNCPAFFLFLFFFSPDGDYFAVIWKFIVCLESQNCISLASLLHAQNNLIYCKCTELQCPEAYLKLACFSVLKTISIYFSSHLFQANGLLSLSFNLTSWTFWENLNCLQMKCGHYFYIAMTNVNTSESENVLWVKLNRFFISNVVLMYLGCPESYF